MASTRLPRKVIVQIYGEPILTQVVRQTKRARTLGEVLVATSTSDQDDAASWEGWSCFRCKEEDVLDRYYQLAKA